MLLPFPLLKQDASWVWELTLQGADFTVHKILQALWEKDHVNSRHHCFLLLSKRSDLRFKSYEMGPNKVS